MASIAARLGHARSALHKVAFTASGGRLMRRWGGLPVLLLTTTGRVTGRPRTTILVVPATYQGDPVVVASAGGADPHPQWYRNLARDPWVTTLSAGRREERRAERLRGAAAEEVWREVVGRAPAYGRYRARANREIPLVVLRPR